MTLSDTEIILNFCNMQDKTNTDNLYNLSKVTKQFLVKIVNYMLLKNRGNVDLAKKFNSILGVKDSDIQKLSQMGYKYVKVLDRGKSGTGLLVINNNNEEYVAKIYDKIQKKRLEQEIKMQNDAANLGISPKIVDYVNNDKYRIIIMEKLEKSLVEKFVEDGCQFTIDMMLDLSRIVWGLYRINVDTNDTGLSNYMYDKNGHLKVIDFSDARKASRGFLMLPPIYYKLVQITVFSCFIKNYTPDDKLKTSLDYIKISKGDIFYRGMKRRFADKLTGLRWITKNKETALRYAPKYRGALVTIEAKKDFNVLNMNKEGTAKLIKYAWANNYEKLFTLLYKAFLNPAVARRLVLEETAFIFEPIKFYKYWFKDDYEKNKRQFKKVLTKNWDSHPLTKNYVIESDGNITLKFLDSLSQIIEHGKRISYFDEDREFTEILCEMGFNGYSAPPLYTMGNRYIFPAEEAICDIENFFTIVETKNV